MTCRAQSHQVARMVAPLLGARDDVMDLKAFPNISAAPSTSVWVEYLPSSPPEVVAAILANVMVSPQDGALQPDPDQASDQIRGAIGVGGLDGPHAVITAALRPFLAHLLQDLFHAAPFLAKALGRRAFEMASFAESTGNETSWFRPIGPVRFSLERTSIQHCSVTEH